MKKLPFYITLALCRAAFCRSRLSASNFQNVALDGTTRERNQRTCRRFHIQHGGRSITSERHAAFIGDLLAITPTRFARLRYRSNFDIFRGAACTKVSGSAPAVICCRLPTCVFFIFRTFQTNIESRHAASGPRTVNRRRYCYVSWLVKAVARTTYQLAD